MVEGFLCLPTRKGRSFHPRGLAVGRLSRCTSEMAVGAIGVAPGIVRQAPA
jgi:hypothetical protein